VGPSVKRTKTNGTTGVDITSPSKKRRLDEDGLILMDSANDRLEDDVIEID
jgi:ubiquitin-like 1-activating enzyme E1 B